MSAKFFGPTTTKWQFCKIFAKLNRNHLLMTNIFKLYEYQTFGLLKMHNMCKIWFANNIFSLLRLNKKYFSWFFKGFFSSQKLSCACNYYWILTEDFCVMNEFWKFVLNMIVISYFDKSFIKVNINKKSKKKRNRIFNDS